jgi:hypothetical protein
MWLLAKFFVLLLALEYMDKGYCMMEMSNIDEKQTKLIKMKNMTLSLPCHPKHTSFNSSPRVTELQQNSLNVCKWSFDVYT